MPHRFTCRRGHQWDEDGTTLGKVILCPVCGTAGQRFLAPGSSSQAADPKAATRPPRPLAPTADHAGPGGPSLKTLPPRGSPDDQVLRLAPADSDNPAPPHVLGYAILEVLGRGGMGVVYKARDLQQNRLVALKMILAGGHAGQKELARFRKEAQAIACLEHPNIVQLYDVGEADGHPYFALELVEAGSLADQLDETDWSPRKAARLVRTLAVAVHHAHQRGIVHRDLKPANILLTSDGTPKITDFGLARQLDTSGCHTPSDAVLGTPSYMAPEQAGQAKHVGPAADVYSLGAILYELLTGQPPFQGATTLEIITQVVADDPVSPRLVRPDVPASLENICLKCLRKDPGQRYPSAQALANDLRRFVSGGSVRARKSRPWDGAVKWVRHNPGIAFLIAAVALLFLLSIVAQSVRFH